MVGRFPLFRSAPFAVLALIVVVVRGLGCAAGDTLLPPEARCGDGERQGQELCDDGEKNSDVRPNACRTNCTVAACGDGVRDKGEECDDGNGEVGDGCDSACVKEFVCGDNTCEVEKGESCSLCEEDCCVCGDRECSSAFGETCEICPSECCPDCGNGVIDGNEECDDGGNVPSDGCSPGCTDEDGHPTCGNGVLEAGEQCDDSNVAPLDGCSPTCQLDAVCGDNMCEASRGESCRACPHDCCVNCGNGVIDPGEQCDTTAFGDATCLSACYEGGTLGCSPWCALDYAACTGEPATCGDGKAECGEACDGADLLGASCRSLGYDGDGLACSATCTMDTSACGTHLFYLQESFDGGCPVAGWTLRGDWECGTPTVVGPAAAFSAPACIGTQIDGNYSVDQNLNVATVTSPPINLLTATAPVLFYKAWIDTDGASFDGYNVKVSANGGTTFMPVTTTNPPYNLTTLGEPAWGGDQSTLGWQTVAVDLSAYVGRTVLVRFGFRSDAETVRAGVYLDDVSVAESVAVPLVITTPPALVDGFATQAYATTLAKSGGSTGSVWSVVTGTNHTWLSLDSATGALSGTPALTNVGPVSIRIRVAEPAFPGNTAEKTFSFAVVDTVYRTGFEGACPVGWTLTGDWECGVPSTGPTSAFEGTQCIATQIDASYSANQRFATTTATSPAVSLVGVTAPRLSFRMWLNTQASFDGVTLKISQNGGPFTTLGGMSPGYNTVLSGQGAWSGDQSSLGWRSFTANLTAYAGQSIQLQFAFESDAVTAAPGAYIDDIRILR